MLGRLLCRRAFVGRLGPLLRWCPPHTAPSGFSTISAPPPLIQFGPPQDLSSPKSGPFRWCFCPAGSLCRREVVGRFGPFLRWCPPQTSPSGVSEVCSSVSWSLSNFNKRFHRKSGHIRCFCVLGRIALQADICGSFGAVPSLVPTTHLTLRLLHHLGPTTTISIWCLS
jgi:hypothetical protein